MRNRLLSSDTIRQWTRVSSWRTLAALAFDHICIVTVVLLTLKVWRSHIEQGPHWPLTLAVTLSATLLIGCLQHRIALAGHEGAHYLLHPNRLLNDLLAELFCFFPLYGSLSQYRSKHLSHHLHPNDPDQDQNLAGDRAKRLYARCPMPKPSFIWRYYVKFFWPPTVLMNLRDLFQVITLGSGLSPIPDQAPEQPTPRLSATVLGVIYLLAWLITLHVMEEQAIVTLIATTTVALAVALGICFVLPENRFRKNRGRTAYSRRTAAALRLSFFTLASMALTATKMTTGIDAWACFFILWIFPLIYVFPYLMLLREIYQHGNADTGELTNSRMIRADPFTRWAILGYGNDAHIVHHLYPNVPHHHLDSLHDELCEHAPDYRESVRETHGIVMGDAERLSLLDSLAEPGVDIPSRTKANS